MSVLEDSSPIPDDRGREIPHFRVRNLLGVLAGHRSSIQTAFHTRYLGIVAVLLTISAGFAREYDGEYLAAQWWYVLAPLVVATVLGTILFGLLWLTSHSFGHATWTSGRAWAAFMTCYLLTAPAAWLYAVPYERMLNELDSARCNLLSLTVVSAWRVLVIIQVAAVMFRRPFFSMLFPVLLFSSTATIVGLCAGFRLPEVMAGLKLSDVQILVNRFKEGWFLGSLITWPIALLGTITIARQRPTDVLSPLAASEVSRPTGFMWALAAGSTLVWAAPIGIPRHGPQDEQRLRYEVERRFV